MLSRGMKRAWQSSPRDGRKTWEPPSAALHHVNGKCVVRRLQSGALLLAKHGVRFERPPQSRTKASNWGEGRSHRTAFFFVDDGRTWSSSLHLDERHPVSSRDIAQAANGDIYVHDDRNRTSDAENLFVRFPEENVRAGRMVSEAGSLKNLVKSRRHGMHRAPPAVAEAR